MSNDYDLGSIMQSLETRLITDILITSPYVTEIEAVGKERFPYKTFMVGLSLQGVLSYFVIRHSGFDPSSMLDRREPDDRNNYFYSCRTHWTTSEIIFRKKVALRYKIPPTYVYLHNFTLPDTLLKVIQL